MSNIPSSFKDDIDNYSPKELSEKYGKSIVTIYNWKKKIVEESYATSTLYDANGEVKLKWVKKPNTEKSDIILKSVKLLLKDLPKSVNVVSPKLVDEDNITLYITNDVHIGMLVNGEETYDRDWNLDVAEETINNAFDHLVGVNRPTEYAIVADLGDLLDIDDFSNSTPTNKHTLNVDGRYPQILKTGYKILINAIYKALTKHQKVIFISVAGNHDITSAIAINYIIKEHFANNDRVIIHEVPNFDIKYHLFGKNIFGFTHGDKIKPNQAGEAMAIDCKENFSKSEFRYMFFGHTHIDRSIDTPLCKCESFRNLSPLNPWASANGYRAGLGKMVSITFNKEHGEIYRNTFNITMIK